MMRSLFNLENDLINQLRISRKKFIEKSKLWGLGEIA
jgi:hypothetical protein